MSPALLFRDKEVTKMHLRVQSPHATGLFPHPTVMGGPLAVPTTLMSKSEDLAEFPLIPPMSGFLVVCG